MPMVPYKIALKIASTATTPWELYRMLGEYEADRAQEVKDLILPAKTWAVVAATRGSTADTSKLAYNFPVLHLPSKKLREDLKSRLDRTLGTRAPTRPEGQPPAVYTPRLTEQVAELALLSMQNRGGMAGGGDDGTDMYLKGVEHAMRLNAEQNSDTVYKRFTANQKAAVCGFCGVTSWRQVPEIWHQIEKTKSEEELRKILVKRWQQLSGDPNVMFYDV
jgi:hypothetical protein